MTGSLVDGRWTRIFLRCIRLSVPCSTSSTSFISNPLPPRRHSIPVCSPIIARSFLSAPSKLPAPLDPPYQVSIQNNPHILSFFLSNQYLQLQSPASSMPHCTIRTSPGGMEDSRSTPGLSLNSCFFGFIALLLSCVLFLAACFLRVYLHDITNAIPAPDQATYILFSPTKTWTLTTYPAHD